MDLWRTTPRWAVVTTHVHHDDDFPHRMSLLPTVALLLANTVPDLLVAHLGGLANGRGDTSVTTAGTRSCPFGRCLSSMAKFRPACLRVQLHLAVRAYCSSALSATHVLLDVISNAKVCPSCVFEKRSHLTLKHRSPSHPVCHHRHRRPHQHLTQLPFRQVHYPHFSIHF